MPLLLYVAKEMKNSAHAWDALGPANDARYLAIQGAAGVHPPSLFQPAPAPGSDGALALLNTPLLLSDQQPPFERNENDPITMLISPVDAGAQDAEADDEVRYDSAQHSDVGARSACVRSDVCRSLAYCFGSQAHWRLRVPLMRVDREQCRV